jgi:hypothetical protein
MITIDQTPEECEKALFPHYLEKEKNKLLNIVGNKFNKYLP